VMYGVTMQEPGVSKVISVNFGDERRQLATAWSGAWQMLRIRS